MPDMSFQPMNSLLPSSKLSHQVPSPSSVKPRGCFTWFGNLKWYKTSWLSQLLIAEQCNFTSRDRMTLVAGDPLREFIKKDTYSEGHQLSFQNNLHLFLSARSFYLRITFFPYFTRALDGPPETCRSDMSWDICEELIVTMVARRDLDSNSGCHSCGAVGYPTNASLRL